GLIAASPFPHAARGTDVRILVTGGAGFIGSNLVRALVRDGGEVAVVDNLVTARSLRLIHDVTYGLHFVPGAVCVPADLEGLPPGPWDVVYHLAASFANELSIEDPELDYRTNVDGTRRVLELARRRGCGLFVYAGTSSTYGDLPPPFREDGPISPHTPYARS